VDSSASDGHLLQLRCASMSGLISMLYFVQLNPLVARGSLGASRCLIFQSTITTVIIIGEILNL